MEYKSPPSTECVQIWHYRAVFTRPKLMGKQIRLAGILCTPRNIETLKRFFFSNNYYDSNLK